MISPDFYNNFSDLAGDERSGVPPPPDATVIVAKLTKINIKYKRVSKSIGTNFITAKSKLIKLIFVVYFG